jgi:hypothetical protein
MIGSWLRSLLVAGTGLTAAFAVQPAQAVTFLWNYSGGALSGGGKLEATYEGGVTYMITSISGLANGVPISGLTDYDFNPSQLIFYPNPPNVVTDAYGFSFGIGDGSNSYNIYEDDGLWTGTYYGCGAVYCILGPGATDSSGVGGTDVVTALDSLKLTLVAVPEPSTWAMMLIGFVGLGFVSYRKVAFG